MLSVLRRSLSSPRPSRTVFCCAALVQSLALVSLIFRPANGDAIASQVMGVSTTTFGYTTNTNDMDPTGLTPPSGAVTSWTFDHAGRITRQQSQTGASTIASDYTFGDV